MTREQITTILTDSGVEAQKGLVTALLNAYNQEKSVEIEAAKAKAVEETEAKFKDYKSPDDFKKINDELTTLKDSSAKATRIAKYKAKGFNTDDEDVANMLDGKFKDSKEDELDKALDAYAKAHPSFLIAKEEPTGRKSTFFQGLGGNKGKADESENQKMNDSIRGAFGSAKEE